MRWRATALAGLAVVAAGAGAAVSAVEIYDAPGPLEAPRDVVIPRGGPDQIGTTLMEAGVIDRPFAFKIAALVTRGQGPLHAAELQFPAMASLHDVLTVLRSGRPIQHRLSVPEGLTSAQIARLIEQNEVLTGQADLPGEGAFLPDTYLFDRGTTREVLVERGRVAMERALARTWGMRAANLPLASPQEALILASIVERETGKAEERAHVAGVFLNRLRLGMKLQSDPTVIYGASGGLGVLDHPITRAELDRDDPYNTYRIAGLPAGPICNPGVAALRAVVQPARTDDLYFVADGTGGHAFARTEEEHLRNVARWREIERARAGGGGSVRP